MLNKPMKSSISRLLSSSLSLLSNQDSQARAIGTLGAAVLISMAMMPAVWPANPAGSAVSEQVMGKEVSLMENRFFAHLYNNDPMEKRLERLELMIFGGTQAGSNDERCARLKKVIAERPQGSQRKGAAAPSPADDSGTKKGDASSSSSQYPVLNTLEWRAMKKTYPNESLDDRLSRMEKKLFGMDSPTMAYIDRVERLKRTVGIGMTAAEPSGPTGPAPKARPHSENDADNFYQGAPSFRGGGTMFGAPSFSFGDDGMGGGLGGLNGIGGFPGMSRTFARMFEDMNREMQEFSKLGPGTWTFDSESGDWIEQETGQKVHPGPNAMKPQGQTPQSKIKPNFQMMPKNSGRQFTIPRQPQMMQPPVFQFPRRHSEPELPPYADPNTI